MVVISIKKIAKKMSNCKILCNFFSFKYLYKNAFLGVNGSAKAEIGVSFLIRGLLKKLLSIDPRPRPRFHEKSGFLVV